MTIEQQISEQLTALFEPTYLQIINQSHQHAAGSAESHFKVVLVSALFKGASRLARHRSIYQALQALLEDRVHALALHLYDDAEWCHDGPQRVSQSPPCRGGEQPTSTLHESKSDWTILSR